MRNVLVGGPRLLPLLAGVSIAPVASAHGTGVSDAPYTGARLTDAPLTDALFTDVTGLPPRGAPV